jgi:hypothetical protein
MILGRVEADETLPIAAPEGKGPAVAGIVQWLEKTKTAD